MSSREQSLLSAGRVRSAVAVVLVLATAVAAAVLGHRAVALPSPVAPSAVPAHGDPRAAGPTPGPPVAAEGPTVDDGVLPDGVSVFDDGFPAVAGLDPDLASALRRAATAAAGDGVEIVVTSGWRSAAYQDQLFREAVAEHGSAEEAARWVATAETSAHVTGDAVDLGPAEAWAWLSEHGAGYGLCRVHRNEPWHHELRPGAVAEGCPAPYADPTEDPRMQR